MRPHYVCTTLYIHCSYTFFHRYIQSFAVKTIFPYINCLGPEQRDTYFCTIFSTATKIRFYSWSRWPTRDRFTIVDLQVSGSIPDANSSVLLPHNKTARFHNTFSYNPSASAKKFILVLQLLSDDMPPHHVRLQTAVLLLFLRIIGSTISILRYETDPSNATSGRICSVLVS